MSQRDKAAAPSATSGKQGGGKGGHPSRNKARDRLAAERAAQQAAQQRRDRMVRLGLVGLVVLVVVAIGVVVIATRKPAVDTKAAVPPGVTDTKGYPFGTVATPVLDVYEDFQCPSCDAFEKANGAKIEALATDGKAKVVYHMVAILDRVNSGGETANSSTRAAAAGGCAQAQGKFLPFHNTVYANQPQEGVGYTNAKLKDFGKQAGVANQSAFDSCVDDQTYAGFVGQVNQEADQRQVTQTPTFMVNGKPVDTSGATSWADMGNIVVSAVDKAK
jgi:protein-disulfide isomerase